MNTKANRVLIALSRDNCYRNKLMQCLRDGLITASCNTPLYLPYTYFAFIKFANKESTQLSCSITFRFVLSNVAVKSRQIKNNCTIPKYVDRNRSVLGNSF